MDKDGEGCKDYLLIVYSTGMHEPTMSSTHPFRHVLITKPALPFSLAFLIPILKEQGNQC